MNVLGELDYLLLFTVASIFSPRAAIFSLVSGTSYGDLLFLSEPGIPVGGGSDSGVTPMDPVLGLHAAANQSYSENSVDIQSALRMFTLDAAYCAFEEHQKGSITPAERMDMVQPVRLTDKELSDYQKFERDSYIQFLEGEVTAATAAALTTKLLQYANGAMYLPREGVDKICKKIGEESAETIIAAKNDSKEELTYEASDLLYHLTVLLNNQGVTFDDLFVELTKRHK